MNFEPKREYSTIGMLHFLDKLKGGRRLNKKILSLLVLLVLLLSMSLVFILRGNGWGSSKMTEGDISKPPVDTPNQIEPDKPNDDSQTGDNGDGGGSGLNNSCENQSQSVEITKNKYQDILDYPQVINMSCKSAEEKINKTIETHIKASYDRYLELEEDEKEQRQSYEDQFGQPVPEEEEYMYNYNYSVSYEIKYNENNIVSILLYEHIYSGGAHGMTNVTSYNFNLKDGQQLYLEDIAANVGDIKQFVVNELKNRPEVFIESLDEIQINENRPFYFTPDGIVIKFFESEIGPYAAGMLEVEVPNEVYQ